MSRPHLITLDSSNAIGRDPNAIVFIDITDGSVTAVCRVVKASLIEFSDWLADILIQYRNTTLLIENKSSAQGILDVLAARLVAVDINPFVRIYNRILSDSSVSDDVRRDVLRNGTEMRRYLDHKDKFGIMTSSKLRDQLYSQVLINSVKKFGHLIRSQKIITELSALILKNGRVDHPTNGHDDMVISWLFGMWFIMFGSNISSYGIDRSKLLSRFVERDSMDKLFEQENIFARQAIRSEINGLRDLMASTKSAGMIAAIQHKLVGLVARANSDGGEKINLDNFMNEVKTAPVAKKKNFFDRTLKR